MHSISIFIDYLQQYVTLDSEEVEAIKAGLEIKTFAKGTVLLKEGQIANLSYFNLKGCIRRYQIYDGEERTTYFHTENQFVTSIKSLTQRTAATHYFECIEPTVAVVIPLGFETELLKTYPKFERLSRILLEQELCTYQEMLARYIVSKPEERYRDLQKLKPELIQRIPQYQLASYLGVTPQSLSRIRKRIS